MKRIVIVGATSGIGLMVAERLAMKGERIGIAGRKDDVMRALQRKYPGQVVWSHIDVTAEEAPAHLHDLIRRLGGMDTYFHVAGIGYENPDLRTDKETRTLLTNVVGFAHMVDTAYRYFRDECHGRGCIAAITSVAGTNGIGRLASYSASKKFQQTYLRALNQLSNIQKLHIRFTDIRPGWVKTPLLEDDRKYPMCMTLDTAVPKVMDALRRKPRVSVVDWRWNILVGLWRLIPNALWVKLPISVSQPAAAHHVSEPQSEPDVSAPRETPLSAEEASQN